jgi:hydrogenase/urease accessory protein HupE
MIRHRPAALALAMTSAAGPVSAHGTLPGGDGFYAGLLHPVYAVAHLVALVALGLLLGRAGMRVPLLALAAGAAAGLGLPGLLPPTAPLMAATAVAAAALALDLRLPLAAVAALAAATGLAIGTDSEAPTPVAIAGLFTGTALVTLNAMAAAQPLSTPARVMVLRVAGSWLGAVALLLLALAASRTGSGA